MKRDLNNLPAELNCAARIPGEHETMQTSGSLTLHALDGPFGMEAKGVDLSGKLTTGLRQSLNKALVEQQVLLFRNQQLGDAQIREVASWFGDVRVLPRVRRKGEEIVPGVRHLTNLGADGRPSGKHPDPFSREWHADGAWMQIPARATVLYALEVPREGGATQFADMVGGLEGFNESERGRLDKLEVIHDVELARVLRFGRAVNINQHVGRKRQLGLWLRFLRRLLPGATTVHPVIRISPENGRAAIVLGADAWRIRGMGWYRGMREVARLTQRSVRSELILTHYWRPGDLVIWDNRSLLHRVEDYDFKREARVMRQVVICGRTS